MTEKLVSLDVWNTLIKSNPYYAKERDKFLASELYLPLEIVKLEYQKIKIESDKMAEQEGECLSNKDIYKKLLSMLGREEFDWMKIRKGMEVLFCEYPPYIFPETIESLQALQENGIGLSIASNTNFIRGELLHKTILNKWGINWKFQIFSDHIKVPKPNPLFWKYIIKKAHDIKEIIHIGDNTVCDGSCSLHGIQFHHIRNPGELSRIVNNIIQ